MPVARSLQIVEKLLPRFLLSAFPRILHFFMAGEMSWQSSGAAFKFGEEEQRARFCDQQTSLPITPLCGSLLFPFCSRRAEMETAIGFVTGPEPGR